MTEGRSTWILSLATLATVWMLPLLIRRRAYRTLTRPQHPTASSLFIEHRDDLKLQPYAYVTPELAVEKGRPVRDPKTGHTTEEHVYWQSPSGCASGSKRRQYAFEEKRQAKICGKLSASHPVKATLQNLI
ncbi:hypothetical protein MRX96_032564 [Rhipicephalus microplus]